MKLRRVQFGYCYIYGKISVEKSESQIVKEIFDKYIQGNSLLKIADSLNKRHIEYAPDVIGWNKARLKRIIENECYIGKNNYPVVIDERIFIKAQDTKNNRNTQKSTNRHSDIYQLNVPIVCAKCGSTMKRKKDSRNADNTKWICQKCGLRVKISDEKLLSSITDILNYIIGNSAIIEQKTLYENNISNEVRKTENEVYRLLDKPYIDKETVMQKIYELISLKYLELNNTEYNTYKLKKEFEKSNLLSVFSMPLFSKTVRSIKIYTAKEIKLILKNNKEIGVEQMCKQQ